MADTQKSGGRWVTAIFLTSAALAAVWYLINIPYDISTKLFSSRTKTAETHPDQPASGPVGPQNQQTPQVQTQTGKAQPEPANAAADQQSARGSPGRYENTSIVRKEGKSQAAVLLWAEDSRDTPINLQSFLTDVVAHQGVQPIQTFFTPDFVRSGYASRLIAGDWRIARQLDLGNHIDYVLIGATKVTYLSDKDFEGLWTANLSLEIKCLNAVTINVCGARSLSVPGAGYSQKDALASATDHMKPQLESLVTAWLK
ncbi:MAG TPA: hypothetical protein VKY85_08825 [Candidatus Angelobacter sp.]|nr:hypothetical protein [Candidatus Angelobacter sp.]